MENLLYGKEDLILPHTSSVSSLIAYVHVVAHQLVALVFSLPLTIWLLFAFQSAYLLSSSQQFTFYELIVNKARGKSGPVCSLTSSLCLLYSMLRTLLPVAVAHVWYHFLMSSFSYRSLQLFHFDVHEDIRTSADARIEKDEVSPAAILIILVMSSLVQLCNCSCCFCSPMQGRLWSDIGMTRISTFFPLQDGR